MEFKYIIKLLLLTVCITPAFGYEYSVKEVIESKKQADNFFSFGDYKQSLEFYYNLADQKNASDKIKADSWKKAGIIKYHSGEYMVSIDHFNKAKYLGLNDKKIKEILSSISRIKSINNNDGLNSYIIQLGIFNSSNNANNFIQSITPINGELYLSKEKRKNLYVVYYDGFKNKNEADKVADQLKSLNNNIKLFVKMKGS